MAFSGLKGKGKASNPEDESVPTVTYRHLHNNKTGALDPLRVVALCDLDAFYASAERVRLNIDPELPLAVQQWQGLIAVNYPARKFGISRMETVPEAKKKCPELVLVHVATYKEGESEAGYWENPNVDTHKVSLDYYRRESLKILNVHRECMPAGVEVEKASIDEAFFDFTTPIKETILTRYPHLANIPEEGGLDAPLPPPPPITWDGLGNLVPNNPVTEALPNEEGSKTASPPPPDEPPPTWHDVALSIAAEIMLKSRMEVKCQLGYTTSAGIARNKMLAKLIASYRKQDQQSVLRNSAIAGFLRPMPFQKIRFLGGKLGEAMADEFGANTVGDVLEVSLDEMQKKFGEESIWVYNVLRGVDHSEVKDKVATKSMLASKNVKPPLTKHTEVTHWLRVLSSELAIRLAEARETTGLGLWPKSVVMGFRQAFGATKHKQCPFPFSKVITPEIILKPAEKLFKELTGGGTAQFKINNISLGFHGLGVMEAGQRGIEGFFAGGENAETSGLGKRRRDEVDPDETMEIEVDGVPDPPPPEASKVTRPSLAQSSSSSTSVPAPSKTDSNPSTTRSFHCARCKKSISLSSKVEPTPERFERLKAEHDDFHVAQDFAREVIDVSSDDEVVETAPPTKKNKISHKPPPKAKTKAKAKGKAEGIAQYFQSGAKKG